MRTAHFVILFFAFTVVSCLPDPEPIEQVEFLKPLKLTDPGGTRELVYDDIGRITAIVITSDLGNGQQSTSTTSYIYDVQGRISESTTDTGWNFKYRFTGARITSTNEYVNGELSQQHTFTYDSVGRLKTRTTTQDIPDQGGIVPVSSESYKYDEKGNVTVLELYYYSGGEKRLLTRFVYSEYDDKICSDEYFYLNPFNPYVHVRVNNPGKLEITNSSGVLTSTETYTYDYHSKGYATRKTTLSVSQNGSNTTVTEYEFE